MTESSALCGGWGGGEDPFAAQECPQDVDASTREGELGTEDRADPRHRLDAAATQRTRGLIAGQRNQRALVRRVVEGPFQRRKDPGKHIAEPVDETDPVSDQIRAVRGLTERS